MKQLKKILVTFMAVALFLVPVLSTPLTANAEGEPLTYYLKYLPDLNTWRFQVGGWAENGYHRDLVFIKDEIKDGDHLVIDGSIGLAITVDVNLGSITVVQAPVASIITAKSTENCYIINNSVAAINGDVKNAYVYDASRCTFNNNVQNLEIIKPKADLLEATVSVAGTVDHLKGYGSGYTHYELYNFAANSLFIENGSLKTDKSKFSNTPVAAEPTPAPTAVPVAPSTPVTTTPSTPSDAYDDVPKTNDIRFNPLWFVGMAALSLAGACYLKKEK